MFKKKSIKYSLAPQTEFYDSMSLSLSWKPFIMFGNFSNIRNIHCNTDSFGLRYNNFNNEKNYKNINNSIFLLKKIIYHTRVHGVLQICSTVTICLMQVVLVLQLQDMEILHYNSLIYYYALV